MSNFIDFISANFPKWSSEEENVSKIKSLTYKECDALHSLLKMELSNEIIFKDVAGNLEVMKQFGYELNLIASELLSELSQKIQDVTYELIPHFAHPFDSSIGQEGVELAAQEVRSKGYSKAPFNLSQDSVQKVLNYLSKQKFVSRFDAGDIVGGSLMKSNYVDRIIPSRYHDTYWLKDQDSIVRDPFIFRLAFSREIISVVENALGCTPIHVQTNAWFSFPSSDKSNSSENAQQFHQDKEFIKFVKVFIYLSDVNDDDGPHYYVERSHLDDLCSKGIPYSDRVSDSKIKNYYASERIKKITGAAGTIIFGDTSCAHKGKTVISGPRIILQLEYASSLYMTSVSPFNDLQNDLWEGVKCPAATKKRLFANYNSKLRADFLELQLRLSLRNEANINRSFVMRALGRVKKFICHYV